MRHFNNVTVHNHDVQLNVIFWNHDIFKLCYFFKIFLVFLNFSTLKKWIIYIKTIQEIEQLRELQMTSTNCESQVSSTKLSKVKKILEAHRSFDNDTTDIVGKISTRKIQQHQGKSPMVNEVYHTSYPNANEPRHIQTARLALSSHRS